MNSRFDTFIKKAILVCIGITALSGLLLFSYADSKGLTFDEVFQEGMVTVNYGGIFFDGDFDIDHLGTNFSGGVSRYETVTQHIEDTFPPVDALHISTSIEEIIFITEDREDILVVYDREKPDTSSYSVNYRADVVGDRLEIKASLRTSGLNIDQAYKGSVTLYLPENHHFEELDIHTDFGSNNMTLPESIDDLEISVDFGTIDIHLPNKLESLDLQVDAGDLHFLAEKPIGTVKAQVNTGEITYELQERVGTLEIQNDIGQIIGLHLVSPSLADIECDMGNMELTFEEPINTLNARVDIGDLNIDVSRNDHSTVYIRTDIAGSSSVLDTTGNKDKANVFVQVDLGDVDIY